MSELEISDLCVEWSCK